MTLPVVKDDNRSRVGWQEVPQIGYPGHITQQKGQWRYLSDGSRMKAAYLFTLQDYHLNNT